MIPGRGESLIQPGNKPKNYGYRISTMSPLVTQEEKCFKMVQRRREEVSMSSNVTIHKQPVWRYFLSGVVGRISLGLLRT